MNHDEGNAMVVEQLMMREDGGGDWRQCRIPHGQGIQEHRDHGEWIGQKMERCQVQRKRTREVLEEKN